VNRVLVLWIAAGLLIGGAYSFYKNPDVPKTATIIIAVLAALALIGAILWSV
jgi:hypothetical protein